MAMRSVTFPLGVTRSMDTTRGAMTRFFSDKGKVLNEEERARENVYIQKMEKDKMEKLKNKSEKDHVEKDKEGDGKKN